MTRRVTCLPHNRGLDDELFGSDERGEEQQTREVILNDSMPQDVMQLNCEWGDKCRVELRLRAQQLDDQNVRINGNFDLFEEASTGTNDQDGHAEFEILVPRSRTVSETQRVVKLTKAAIT
jgi:hypothetical protein